MATAPTTNKSEDALDPRLREHWWALKADLERQGWQPVIASAWRDPRTQKNLYETGASTVAFSFHQALDAEGRPAALAVDIIDRRYGWEPKDAAKQERAAAFFRALGLGAKARGLSWGGDWKQTNVWAKWGMGWDPGHIQLYPNSALGKVKQFTLDVMGKAGALVRGAPAPLKAGFLAWLVGGALFLGFLGVAAWRKRRAARAAGR
jgi:hypothetical protein